MVTVLDYDFLGEQDWAENQLNRKWEVTICGKLITFVNQRLLKNQKKTL